MSYLEGSYLVSDGEEYDADGATVSLTEAPGSNLGDDAVVTAPSDVVVLPGGIVIPKKTLTMIVLAIAVAVAVVYVMRQRDRRALAAEEAIDES